jgi:hypothetical protein
MNSHRSSFWTGTAFLLFYSVVADGRMATIRSLADPKLDATEGGRDTFIPKRAHRLGVTKDSEMMITGVVTRVDEISQAFIVRTVGSDLALVVDDHTHFFLDSSLASWKHLSVGSYVKIRYESDNGINPAEEIAHIADDIYIASDGQATSRQPPTSQPRELLPRAQGERLAPKRTRRFVGSTGPRKTVRGSVTAVDEEAQAFVVHRKVGSDLVLVLDDQTKFYLYLHGRETQWNDLAQGAEVVVEFFPDGMTTLVADHVVIMPQPGSIR